MSWVRLESTRPIFGLRFVRDSDTRNSGKWEKGHQVLENSSKASSAATRSTRPFDAFISARKQNWCWQKKSKELLNENPKDEDTL